MLPKLLIVDDEEPILSGMRHFFQNEGFDVDCAARVEDAPRLLSQRRHDALLAELRLGAGGSELGLLLIERVRAASPATLIVLLSAYAAPETEREAQRLGVGAILRKPLPLPELARVVRALLDEAAR